MKYVKVCGLRDPKNIEEVIKAGATAVGMIFYDKSPRGVTIETDSDKIIFRTEMEDKMQVPRFGVFVNESIETVLQVYYDYSLSVIQLHGEETPEYCRQMRDKMQNIWEKQIVPAYRSIGKELPANCCCQIVKTISISKPEDLQKYKEYVGVVDFFLFDTKCEEKGGSGQQFDWSILDQYDGDLEFLLSGGIGPDDLERCKAFNHPKYGGIDINSKFEVSPGIKDAQKVKEFIDALGPEYKREIE